MDEGIGQAAETERGAATRANMQALWTDASMWVLAMTAPAISTERVEELRDYFAREASPPKQRPTIAELEKMLNQDTENLSIEIKPDGSITAVSKSLREDTATALSRLLELEALAEAVVGAKEKLQSSADLLMIYAHKDRQNAILTPHPTIEAGYIATAQRNEINALTLLTLVTRIDNLKQG